MLLEFWYFDVCLGKLLEVLFVWVFKGIVGSKCMDEGRKKEFFLNILNNVLMGREFILEW